MPSNKHQKLIKIINKVYYSKTFIEIKFFTIDEMKTYRNSIYNYKRFINKNKLNPEYSELWDKFRSIQIKTSSDNSLIILYKCNDYSSLIKHINYG